MGRVLSVMWLWRSAPTSQWARCIGVTSHLHGGEDSLPPRLPASWIIIVFSVPFFFSAFILSCFASIMDEQSDREGEEVPLLVNKRRSESEWKVNECKQKRNRGKAYVSRATGYSLMCFYLWPCLNNVFHSVCMLIDVFLCLCVCECVCLNKYACVCVCMYVCTYTYIHFFTHTPS